MPTKALTLAWYQKSVKPWRVNLLPPQSLFCCCCQVSLSLVRKWLVNTELICSMLLCSFVLHWPSALLQTLPAAPPCTGFRRRSGPVRDQFGCFGLSFVSLPLPCSAPSSFSFSLRYSRSSQYFVMLFCSTVRCSQMHFDSMIAYMHKLHAMMLVCIEQYYCVICGSVKIF